MIPGSWSHTLVKSLPLTVVKICGLLLTSRMGRRRWAVTSVAHWKRSEAILLGNNGFGIARGHAGDTQQRWRDYHEDIWKERLTNNSQWLTATSNPTLARNQGPQNRRSARFISCQPALLGGLFSLEPRRGLLSQQHLDGPFSGTLSWRAGTRLRETVRSCMSSEPLLVADLVHDSKAQEV